MAKARPPNDSPEEGVEPPNYTQIPNELFDLIPTMSEKELKVTLIICRETFGWHRKEEELSLTDLENKTGLSRQGVISGIKAGMARGLIKRRPRGKSFLYRLKIVQNLDHHSQNNGLIRGEIPLDESQKFRPSRVQNLDSHEDERKGKKDSGGGGGAHARKIEQSPLNFPPEPPPDAPTESELLLLQFRPEPFSKAAAYEFRDLPPGVVRSELAAATASNTGPGALVLRWRRVQPTLTTGDAYEHSTPAARRNGAGNGRRSDSYQRGRSTPVPDPARDADEQRQLAEFEQLADELNL